MQDSWQYQLIGQKNSRNAQEASLTQIQTQIQTQQVLRRVVGVRRADCQNVWGGRTMHFLRLFRA